MPSSTSSSESRRILALAAGIAVLAIVSLETFARSLGVAPSVLDSKDLWSEIRDDVYGRDKVVLIGASRILFDLSPQTFEAKRPGLQVRQLGLGATWGGAVLRDLARDPDFDGLVIASMRAEGLERSHWDAQQDYVDYYHEEWSFNKRVSTRLATELARRLALMNPSISLARLAEKAINEGALPELWLVFRDDRSIHADFTKRARVPDAMVRRVVEGHYARYPISPPDEWLAATAPVEEWIDEIQSRGGRVAFVRFPTSRSHWRVDEEHYPRAHYWDRFAARTSAVAIHFRDSPKLLALELPDSSHLDHRDAPAFTEGLVELLEAERFFDRAGTE